MALGSLTPIAPSTASTPAMRAPVRVLWVDVFEARAGDRFAMAVVGGKNGDRTVADGASARTGSWLYNVSGWEAVEITLATGKRLRRGIDELRRLA